MKPAFYTDEELGDLPLEAHFLYGGLFCQADLEGRLEDRPRTIKLAVFPFRDIDVEPLLALLAQPKANRPDGKPFILRYEVGPTKIIQIVEFQKHQRISGKEAESVSIFAPHPDWEAMGKRWGSTREASETAGKGFKEREVERGLGKGKGKASPPAKAGHLSIPFDLLESKAEIEKWLTFKAEKHQSYKGEQGLNALWSKLRAMGTPARRAAAIQHSMANNYQGLFEAKGGRDGKAPHGFKADGKNPPHDPRRPSVTL